MSVSFSPAHCSPQLALSRRFNGLFPWIPFLYRWASQPGDCHVLAGEWEYVDGAVDWLTLGEQGNSHYDWKDGGFETQPLIGHTWHGMWF